MWNTIQEQERNSIWIQLLSQVSVISVMRGERIQREGTEQL